MPSRDSWALALLLAACSGGGGRVGATSLGYGETGIATWYGEEAAGHRTASGERFDPAGLTAAHRTLPLGSLVEVTALGSGRTIVARVNDRGPGRRDRVIDLSRGAAHLLGTDRDPLARVRLRLVAPGEGRVGLVRDGAPIAGSPSPAPGRYWLQVASFSYRPRAQALADRLGGEVTVVGDLYRVRVGPLASARDAEQARDAAAAQGYADARLLPAP